ncbi:MAG: hypothetical protein ACJ8AH_25025, partial [Stellaceae bacterium]
MKAALAGAAIGGLTSPASMFITLEGDIGFHVPIMIYWSGGNMLSARDVHAICHAALAWKPGMVIVFQIVVDESGTHALSPTLAVAAYVGRPDDWRKFTSEWNRQKKPINA